MDFMEMGINVCNSRTNFCCNRSCYCNANFANTSLRFSFSAGAMIFIVVEEVIPESQSGGNTDLATMGLIAGFIVMMILDVSLG